MSYIMSIDVEEFGLVDAAAQNICTPPGNTSLSGRTGGACPIS